MRRKGAHEDPDRLRRPLRRIAAERWVEMSEREALDEASSRIGRHEGATERRGGARRGVIGEPQRWAWTPRSLLRGSWLFALDAYDGPGVEPPVLAPSASGQAVASAQLALKLNGALMGQVRLSEVDQRTPLAAFLPPEACDIGG